MRALPPGQISRRFLERRMWGGLLGKMVWEILGKKQDAGPSGWAAPVSSSDGAGGAGSIGTGETSRSVSCACARSLQHRECPPSPPVYQRSGSVGSGWRAGHRQCTIILSVVSPCVTCCISIFHFLLDSFSPLSPSRLAGPALCPRCSPCPEYLLAMQRSFASLPPATGAALCTSTAPARVSSSPTLCSHPPWLLATLGTELLCPVLLRSARCLSASSQ